jgi:uncharacterized circularly permuted ATP-grasp superfamily protein/uncharacterized alpha-E superfamily protein
MVDGRGGLRLQWRSLLGTFHGLGEGGLAQRGRRLERIHEPLRPGAEAVAGWRCDPVPLVLTGREFAELESGLAQRARLLSAVLDDLYGPQALLAAGALPPALVFANPGFLRPCRSAMEPGARLLNYAADLLRGPDGAWRVVADRTGAPTGAGVALENRRALAAVLPEAFRPVPVQPLRPFFDEWENALHRLAPRRSGGSAVTLLAPGSAHPGWWEHVVLARELSATLVEAADLTVRGDELFLKTLGGLQPIDLVLRRIDGHAVDPLELDGATRAGVPGLLQAARNLRVRIVNDPGVALAEAPALAAFLPALADRLLGERLLLPSLRTLWLGDKRARVVVERDPAGWLIGSAVDGSVGAVDAAGLAEAERRQLMDQIAECPWAFAARAIVPASLAPSLVGDGLQPLPVSLRMFLVCDGRDWQALQGGLARVLEAEGPLGGALPHGGLAKDVWVTSEARTNIAGPPVLAVPPLKIRRSTGDLPSRVADDLFWLGRSVERLERAARLARAALWRLMRAETLLPRQSMELGVLTRCLVEAKLIDVEQGSPALLGRALLGLVRPPRPGERLRLAGLFAEVARLIEGVRDRLTGDMYDTFVHSLEQARIDADAVGTSLEALARAMTDVQRFATLVAGVAADNMVRGGGFLFLDLGRRLERALSVAAELATALDQPAARIDIGLSLALELCDSQITYRSRYGVALQPAPVLDLALADPGNPRGLAFQLTAMHELLDQLSAGAPDRERLAGQVAGLLAEAEALVDSVKLATEPAEIVVASLAPGLREIAADLAGLSDRITRRFFALLPALQAIGRVDEEEEEADPVREVA